MVLVNFEQLQLEDSYASHFNITSTYLMGKHDWIELVLIFHIKVIPSDLEWKRKTK